MWYIVYGTDLMQRHTRMRVTGYHLQSARTWLSMSFNELELGARTQARKKTSSEHAVRQTISDNKGTYCYELSFANPL